MTDTNFLYRIQNIGKMAVDRTRRLLRQYPSWFWNSYSRLFFVGVSSGWVLSWEAREIARICEQNGMIIGPKSRLDLARRQCVFYPSAHKLMNSTYPQRAKVTGAYFHGIPGTGDDVFDRNFELLKRNHECISRIQVTNHAFKEIILESGIAEEKVHLIPIGINPDFFQIQTQGKRKLYREKYGIPQEAVIIGSFQKDGNGWDEGNEPKLIKGPDVFLKTVEILKSRIPELFILLSGPARGYVKSGLERMNVPFRHIYLEHYPDIGELYQCLDLYIVTSRQEGGPKSVLESMASGVPIISTRVGQAVEMIRHGENGWLADIEDEEALAYWAEICLQDSDLRLNMVSRGVETSQQNTYTSQKGLWRIFFDGIVESNHHN